MCGSFLMGDGEISCELTHLVRSVRLHVCAHLRVHGCVCVCFCCASWSALTERFSRCGICWLSVHSLLFPDIVQSWGFTKNMKLEAVNPRNPGEPCVASVIAVKGRLMQFIMEGTFEVPDHLNSGSLKGQGPTAAALPQCARRFPRVSAALNYSAFL